MNWIIRIANSLACIVIGASIAAVAALFIVLGVTFLPVIGVLIAFPLLRFSAYFLFHSPSADVTVKKAVAVHSEAPACRWPYQVQH